MNIKIADIIIPERAREWLGAEFDRLKNSIDRRGLIEPIVVSKDMRLLAGFRRLTAFQELGKETIPAVVMETSNENEALMTEWEENALREDFTWQEDLKLKMKIYENIKEKHYRFGALELASILGQSHAHTAREITIWKYAKNNPIIWQCESKRQAHELVIRSRNAELLDERILRMRAEIPDIPSDIQINTVSKNNEDILKSILNPEDITKFPVILYNEALSMLLSLPDHSVDMCLTDPPFGIDIESAKGKQIGIYDIAYTDSKQQYTVLMLNTIAELARVLKPGSHCYMFCGMQIWNELKTIFESHKFSVYQIPMIWYKGDKRHGVTMQPNFYPVNTYEAILFAYAPGDRKKLVKVGLSNVLEHEPIEPIKKIHRLEKPIALYQDILSRSANKGDVIVDPFVGSGALAEAAWQMGLQVKCAEMVEEYRSIITNRLMQIGAEVKNGN